jgi:hypothetical protein
VTNRNLIGRAANGRDKIRAMADNGPTQQPTVGVYENLKRHEEMLRDLKASIEAMKSFVIASGGDPFGRIEDELKRLLAQSDPTTDAQVRLFDEAIARSPGR